jgi:hypothetical protein
LLGQVEVLAVLVTHYIVNQPGRFRELRVEPRQVAVTQDALVIFERGVVVDHVRKVEPRRGRRHELPQRVLSDPQRLEDFRGAGEQLVPLKPGLGDPY